MRCSKCDDEVIEYGSVLIHPPNDCLMEDGVEITVDSEKTQEAFRLIVYKDDLVKEESNIYSGNIFSRIYYTLAKHLKRIKFW